MNKVIRVHRRDRLLSLDAIYGLSDWLNELNKPRREVIQYGTDHLYGWIESDGVIFSGEGDEIEIYPGIFDDAHGEDGSAIWISEQRRRRLHNPPKRKLRSSLLLRMQLYDAVARITTGKSILPE